MALVSTVGLLGAAMAGLRAIGNSINLAGKFETTQVAFEGLLGSAAQANSVLGEIQEFAARTPFRFEGLAQTVRFFTAMGFEGDRAISIVKTLANQVAAMGGNTQLMERLALAFAQIQAAGRLYGTEVRQLRETGLRVEEIIGRAIGRPTSDVKGLIEKGLIDSDTAITAILADIENRTAGSVERLSQTIEGRLSTLKDNVDILFREFGIGFAEGLGLTDFLQDTTKALEDLIPLTREFGDLLGGLAKSSGQVATSLFPNLALGLNLARGKGNVARAAQDTQRAQLLTSSALGSDQIVAASAQLKAVERALRSIERAREFVKRDDLFVPQERMLKLLRAELDVKVKLEAESAERQARIDKEVEGLQSLGAALDAQRNKLVEEARVIGLTGAERKAAIATLKLEGMQRKLNAKLTDDAPEAIKTEVFALTDKIQAVRHLIQVNKDRLNLEKALQAEAKKRGKLNRDLDRQAGIASADARTIGRPSERAALRFAARNGLGEDDPAVNRFRAIRKYQDEVARLDGLVEDLGNTAGQGLEDIFVTAIQNAEELGDVLRNIINQLALDLLRTLAFDPLRKAITAGLGQLVGSSLGGGGDIQDGIGTGSEISRSTIAGAEGGGVTINMTVNAQDADSFRQSEGQIARGLRDAIENTPKR